MPKEIDFNKLENRYKKYPYLYFFTKPLNIRFPLALGASATIAITGTSPIHYFLSAALTLENLFLFYFEYVKYKINYRTTLSDRLSNNIRKTIEYAECERLYRSYINEIAKYLHFINCPSSKELVLYLYGMLTEGSLSTSHNHQYYEYAHYKEYVNELLGAHTLGGKSICRHMTALFNDILYAYGETSAFLKIRTTEQTSADKVLTEPDKIFSHAVVGVKQNDEKFLFDPTNGLFGISTREKVDERTNALVGKIITIPNIYHQYIELSLKQITINESYYDSLIELCNLPFTVIREEELEYYYNESYKRLSHHAKDNVDFYNSTIHLVKDIYALLEEVNPFSDEPIDEWKLTKK